MLSLLGGLGIKDVLVVHLLIPFIFPRGVFPSSDERMGLEEAFKTKAYMIPATRWTSPSLLASDKLSHAIFMAGVYTFFRMQKKSKEEAIKLTLAIGLLVEGWESTEKIFNYGGGEWDFSRWDLFANALGVLWASSIDKEWNRMRKPTYFCFNLNRVENNDQSKNLLSLTKRDRGILFRLKNKELFCY